MREIESNSSLSDKIYERVRKFANNSPYFAPLLSVHTIFWIDLERLAFTPAVRIPGHTPGTKVVKGKFAKFYPVSTAPFLTLSYIAYTKFSAIPVLIRTLFCVCIQLIVGCASFILRYLECVFWLTPLHKYTKCFCHLDRIWYGLYHLSFKAIQNERILCNFSLLCPDMATSFVIT